MALPKHSESKHFFSRDYIALCHSHNLVAKVPFENRDFLNGKKNSFMDHPYYAWDEVDIFFKDEKISKNMS